MKNIAKSSRIQMNLLLLYVFWVHKWATVRGEILQIYLSGDNMLVYSSLLLTLRLKTC